MNFVYPNGAYKAVTLRFDDGVTGDRQMVELLNKYKMKATFYPIVASLDNEGFVTVAEFKDLYKGHEIGNHTYSHYDPRLFKLTSDEVKEELAKGKASLEKIWGETVDGYAYVCSSYGEIGEAEYKKLLDETGHKYAIMGRENNSFVPDINDRFDVAQSFRFSDEDLIAKAEEYKLKCDNELSMFFAMAHTYEFEQPQYDYGWDKVEKFYKIISGQEDIWYATNGEVLKYLFAVEKFVADNQDKNELKNTTDSVIFLKVNGDVIALHSGDCIKNNC